MNNYLSSLILVFGLSSLVFSISGHAENVDIKFNLDAGIEYDSNVNVKALDSVSNVGDLSVLFDAGFKASWNANDKLNLKTSYNYSAKNYKTYHDFSQDINTLAFDINYDVFDFNIGLDHHYAKAKLANNPLLKLSRRSIYAGRIFDQGFYLRSSLFVQEKDFTNAQERNSDGKGLDGDIYYFFNNLKSFVSIGLAYENEDAIDELYDNRAVNFRSRYSNTFKLWSKNNQLQLAWRYSKREYSAYNSSIGDQRLDDQHVMEASWEIEINPKFSIIANIEHGDYQSNLNSANYEETISGLQLKAKF